MRMLVVAVGLSAVGWGANSGARLLVQVRPEVVLTRAGETGVKVRIRLARGAQARVWTDAFCAAPAPGSYVISESGTHTVPLAAIETSGAKNVCLASSDGNLVASIPLPGR